jgi:hypothetical protein
MVLFSSWEAREATGTEVEVGAEEEKVSSKSAWTSAEGDEMEGSNVVAPNWEMSTLEQQESSSSSQTVSTRIGDEAGASGEGVEVVTQEVSEAEGDMSGDILL